MHRKKKDRALRHDMVTMTLQFLVAMIMLAAAKVTIPLTIFETWPTWVISALDILPYLIVGIIVLNISMPAGVIRPAEYILAAILMVPAVIGYDALRQYLTEWFPTVTEGLDIWALEAIPVYALRPAILGLYMLVSFLIIWKIAFGIGHHAHTRYLRLLRPTFLVLAVLLFLTVSYFHMVNYAQIHADGSVYGMLFNRGAPKEATWYHLGALPNLLIYWLASPLESITMAYLVLGGMRALRAGYPAKERKAKEHSTKEPQHTA